MLDLATRIQRRADYLDRTLPKVASPVEIFDAWRLSLSCDEDQAFVNFLAREIWPPDGIRPKISEEEMAQFPVTPEVEAIFEQTDTEFMRRWQSMDDDAKRPYFQ